MMLVQNMMLTEAELRRSQPYSISTLEGGDFGEFVLSGTVTFKANADDFGPITIPATSWIKLGRPVDIVVTIGPSNG